MCMVRTKKNPKKPGHFFRQWRKFRNLSLEQVTERIKELAAARYPTESEKKAFRRIGATHGNLSRIERGLVPYNELLLELLAETYQTDKASLLMRNPEDPSGIWSIWDQIPATERDHAAEVLRTFVPKSDKAA
jgi:transcriptional regulator with XRE-family HTH domain